MITTRVTSDLQFEKVVLEQMRVAASTSVARPVLEQATLNSWVDPLVDSLVARLESYVLADKTVGDSLSVALVLTFPTSPWQFFKQRHAESWWLGWLVRRRPVRTERHADTRVVTFERYNTYPEATIRVRELGRPVVFERYTVEEA